MSPPYQSSVSVKINILVVDDDSTSLSIVSAMLKSYHYDVITAKSAHDALATIRIKKIDLVVTDLHMPKMNGLELQKQIQKEFKLPVIIMSADDRESTLMKSLESGVVFYMVKPINPDDLKSLWQYAVASRRGKSVHIEEMENNQVARSCKNIVSGLSSGNKGNHKKKDSKRTASKRGGEDQAAENNKSPKKQKMSWTNALHNRFLLAIRHIGLEKAVPKKILEYMSVPGLTRENVASHLQKYRLFLKRVAQNVYGISSKNYERFLRSIFASDPLSLVLQNALEYEEIMGNKHLQRTLFQSEYGRRIMRIASLGVSSNSSLAQAGLLGNQANFYRSLFASKSPLYQANGGTTFGTLSDDDATNWLSSLAGASPLRNFETSGWKPNFTSGYEKMGTTNPSYPYYAGIGVNNHGELHGIEQMKLNGNDLNGTSNVDMKAGLMRNATLPYLARGESNSAGFQNTIYRFPPAFASANAQEHASGMPQLSQQGYGLSNNGIDFSSVALMNNSSVSSKTTNPHHYDPSGCQFPLGQHGGENFLNANFPGDSSQPGANVLTNQSQQPDLSNAFCFEDNDLINIFPTLEQLEEIEEIEDQDANFSSFNGNPNQQGGNEERIDSDLDNIMCLLDNFPSENQACIDSEPTNIMRLLDNVPSENQAGIDSEPTNVKPRPANVPSEKQFPLQGWDSEEFLNYLISDSL